jgi:iron-sulfur cluster assembly accessory protein
MINLSKAAVEEIRRLHLRRHNLEARLRLGVKAGGCSELYYTIDFDEAINPGDRVYDYSGLSVIVDEQSFDSLNELTLDYSEDLMGGGFRFHNPKAVESCGCGNSFRVER